MVIGIHQEDKRNFGAHLRSYLDVSFIVLRRDDSDPDELEYYSHADFSKDRELFKKIEFEQGSYVVVPFTSGALLQNIDSKEDRKFELTKATSSLIEVKDYYYATIYDIFRKIDLSANGFLSAEELNQFGVIVNQEQFKKIKKSDFTSSKFKNIS